jgi:hypothetical protein
MIMKSKLSNLMAVIALLALFPSLGQASTYDFSFDNEVGSVAGTVTGEVDVVPSPGPMGVATSLTIDSFPSGVGLSETSPFTVPVSLAPFKTFATSTGDIISVHFFLKYNDYILVLNTAGEIFELSGPSGFVESYALAGSSLAPSATPLPAAIPLFATGLGVMGLLGWRRKRKNAAPITT